MKREMTTDELKALAREYAKELFPEDFELMQKGNCDFEAEEVVKDCMVAFEVHIRYLMQDHYIVKKSEVKANLDWAKHSLEHPINNLDLEHYKGRLVILKELFPNLFK